MKRVLSLSALHLDSIVKRLLEGNMDGDDAVDELASTIDVKPDSALGKALTDLMSSVATHDLLDYYLGYDRLDNIIKAYFSKQADKEELQNLMNDITTEEERRPGDSRPFITGKLYRNQFDPRASDFKWVVELNYVGAEFDPKDLEDVPVEMEIVGDMQVEVPGEKIPEEENA